MRVAVLSTGRQDWGILRSTCLALRDDPSFDLRLIVGGMHTSKRFGLTVELVTQDGCAPAEVLSWLDERGEQPTADETGVALTRIAEALRRQRPHALLLAGDRYETAAGALAATLERIPIVHLHGGEETEGAFDNALRHAITKLSHLHLVSHPEHGARVRAMGEDPATIHVVGVPGLDNLLRDDLADRAELERLLEMPLRPPVVVVTLHPATLGEDPGREATALVGAMERVDATYVITLPNADPGSEITRTILCQAATGPRRRAVAALGDRRYWGLLRIADALLGNSSSALLEAPALGLPAVNIGARQQGRLRGANVLDVDADAPRIHAALLRALDPAFRGTLTEALPPHAGQAAERILAALAAWTPPVPPIKRAIPVSA
jgi:UDP-N-acetylglucosamine 2-epimerase (non-hydrolysing)